jgi:prepilin-type N-terminal cleavage/methylation domain-containing protein
VNGKQKDKGQVNIKMKNAFSLAEILIVVAILGILAALALPTFKGHIAEATEAAAKDNLRILRNAIELYAAKHDGVPPGYGNNDPSGSPGSVCFYVQLVFEGNYLSKRPKNPFNNKHQVKAILNNQDFPTEPVDFNLYGWIYKAATKEIRLNWPGTDSTGVAYFDY